MDILALVFPGGLLAWPFIAHEVHPVCELPRDIFWCVLRNNQRGQALFNASFLAEACLWLLPCSVSVLWCCFLPQVTWSWPMTGSPSTCTRWWWTRSTCPRRSWRWCSRSPLSCQPGTPWGLWPSEAGSICLLLASRSSCNREFQWSEAIAKQKRDRALGLVPIPEM